MKAISDPRRFHARQFLTGGFFLLALVVALAVFFAARQRIDSVRARETMLTSNQLSDLLSSVRQAESGLRGYLLTRNQASLATYDLALKNLPAERGRLDAFYAGEPNADLVDLHQTLATKLGQLGAVAQTFQAGDTAGAVGQVNAALNLGTMQHLRDLVRAMQVDQGRHLAADEALDERNGWILQIATGLAVAFTLLLGWFAIRDAKQRTDALLAAEAALRMTNNALEARIAERTARIAASESKFRTLAESMLGLVFMTDEKGDIRYVNNDFLAYAGIEAGELSGRWITIVHPDDVPAAVAVWTESLETHRPFEVEYRLRRHDGAYRWYLARALPIYDETRQVTGWIGNGTDIEDRKQAETAVRDLNAVLEQRVAERSRELDRIFNLSTDLLTVNDFDGNFLAVSPAWEQITGWPMTDALGRPFMPMVHPDDEAKTAEAFVRGKQGHPQTAFENRYKRADGSYCWLSWRAVTVMEEQRIYSVARDVTEEKARDEQLRQSQKMEVVGQLTGGIAHDFNNLLTIIMGSLEMLQRGLPNADAKATRRIEAAMDGGKRAAALTHRLLAFARRQPLEPKPIEPNRLVAGMADMLARVLGENIDLEFVNAAGLWRTQADVNQLENSILNLAVNARDAMPDGGHLTIETQNAYFDDTYTADRADVQPGQYVMIAVTDTGSGMTPDVRAKVFEPFFTTKPQGAGTGLGLAQVYGFIKQSNGHVTLYSEPGQGTSVKLYLPRLRGAMTQAAVPPAVMIEAAGRGETILLVEDEENVRNFSAEVLEDAGYNVLPVENAAGALAILETGKHIDMLFTDVVLTGTMNGRLLANEVLRLRPATVVLFTTGYTRNAIIHHGRLDDGIDFIGKPFTASALTQIVRKVMNREKTSQPVAE